MTSCAKCPRGTFAADEGNPLTACTACLDDTYGPEAGAASAELCKACPPNTVTESDGRVSVADCRARAGFFMLASTGTSGANASSASIAAAVQGCPTGAK